MHKPESALKNETHKILWDFEIQTNDLIPTRNPDLMPTRNPDLIPIRNPDLIPTRNSDLMPTRNSDLMPTRNPNLMSTRNPHLVLIEKKTYHQMDSAVLADHRVKMKKTKKHWQIFEPCQWIKKSVKQEDDGHTNCCWLIAWFNGISTFNISLFNGIITFNISMFNGILTFVNSCYSWCTWNGPQRFGKILKELEIRGRNETTKTKVFLRSARRLGKNLGCLKWLAVAQTPEEDHQLKLAMNEI